MASIRASIFALAIFPLTPLVTKEIKNIIVVNKKGGLHRSVRTPFLFMSQGSYIFSKTDIQFHSAMPLFLGDTRCNKTLPNRKETANLRQKKDLANNHQDCLRGLYHTYGLGLFFFALFSKNSAALGQFIYYFWFSFTFACAAASLAIGTRNGEQDT